ncbi:hypothetical protein K3G39_11350 [Pontibacter sp. HSC-14F20]|uniref:hypothetical protein n=1 Tax=Pontibacter sp. HSC-14F20 TaxID=2864136 RepID=UPI001C72DF31|nr:hypothetical protein [Pontibacter sp. HSC-14F20]MBX0333832.1 hypothetical protein [Pontibacter sp. HSC-14F20]
MAVMVPADVPPTYTLQLAMPFQFVDNAGVGNAPIPAPSKAGFLISQSWPYTCVVSKQKRMASLI